MKVKNYFDIFLTNPHIGCMRRRFCTFSKDFRETDNEHHGNDPVVPIMISILKVIAVRPVGASKEVVNERCNNDKRATDGRGLDPARWAV